jgi:two-component system, OmpR family, alkaline phosphatase synthesis response regulator PhoP
MKKVLLVEDDLFLVDIYSTKFKESGFEIEVIKKGSGAFEKIKEMKPDIVLLDIILPEVSGWEILKEIRKDKKLKNIKVAILSNLGQEDEIEKGSFLGADKYIVKAYYTPAEVVKEIKKMI